MNSKGAEPVIKGGEYTPLLPPKRQTRLTRPVILATLTACLGAVSFGFVMGYPSPVQKDLHDKLNWSDEQLSWFSVSFLELILCFVPKT